jgi:hypothetical protein
VSDVVPEDLDELRRRVYGPLGDLRSDTDAVARLSALTAQQRTPAAGTARSAPAVTEPNAGLAAESPNPVTPARPGLNRRTRILWVASVAAAVLFTAAATSWIYSPPGSQIAALTLHSDRELPTYGSGYSEGALVTDDFHGLSVIYLGPEQTSSMSEGGCIQVMPTVRNFQANPTFGCGAGPFAPNAPIVVTQTSPRNLRDAFPIGTALQFLLKDGVIEVRSGGQSVVPSAPAGPVGPLD